MVREVNAAAMAIADSAEGCVLHTYLDPRGIPTAGYGHTGPDVRMGTTYTQLQADAWRAADMARAAVFVDEHLKVPLTDNQFSALAEFTYNVGVGNFLGSTLLRLLNKGQYDVVPAQLVRWNKAGGKVLPGLVARRAREAALFTTPDSHTLSVTPLVVTDSVHVAMASAPSIWTGTVTSKPTPPSLLERIGAWLHRNAVAPT